MGHKIAILGAGSVGCYLGGRLLAVGQKVMLVGRPGIQQELQSYGLTVTDWSGYQAKIEPEQLPIFTSGECLAEANIILLTVKSKDTPAAAEQLLKYGQPHSVVVSFQNGVQNAPRLRQLLPQFYILGGMVPYNIVHLPHGRFHCGMSGELMVEAVAELEKPVVTLLNEAGLPTFAPDNMPAIMWGKLLINLNNAINALAGIPLREQLQNPLYRRVFALCMAEGLHVLRANHITPARTTPLPPALIPHLLRLPNWLFLSVARAMLNIDPEARSSMWEDLTQGRKTEIEFINGEIVALGEKVGLATPANRQIMSLIQAAETAGAGSPNLAAEKLWALVKS